MHENSTQGRLDKTELEVCSADEPRPEDYMNMIVNQTKTHEFRKKLYPPTVQRIWFYETAPISAITHICEIGPVVVRPKRSVPATPLSAPPTAPPPKVTRSLAKTVNPTEVDQPLQSNGSNATPGGGDEGESWHLPLGPVGNAEYNAHEESFVGYDYAYPLTSCYRLPAPITLEDFKAYGMASAPRGMVYLPEAIKRDIQWDRQVLVWENPK
jgi:predicted transcriptional regulator